MLSYLTCALWPVASREENELEAALLTVPFANLDIQQEKFHVSSNTIEQGLDREGRYLVETMTACVNRHVM